MILRDTLNALIELLVPEQKRLSVRVLIVVLRKRSREPVSEQLCENKIRYLQLDCLASLQIHDLR